MLKMYILWSLLWMLFAVFGFEVKNDDCSYEVDTNQNIIKVSCDRNVTVKIIDKHGVISMSQKQVQSLWFENMSYGPYRYNRSRSHAVKNAYNRAGTKLKAATGILKRTKKRLRHRNRALANITQMLMDGNVKLQQDLQQMSAFPLGSEMAKQATAAALSNQYNLLNTAMLAQNTAMKELITTMKSLVTATHKSVRSSMAINDQLQEEVLMINTALIQANITKVDKKKDFCPRRLTGIVPTGDTHHVGIAQGSFMRDPIPGGQIWVTYGYSDLNEIVEFDSMQSFTFDVSQRHKLPFFCEGTGHVVYKNVLYCHKVMTNKIVKYNLMEGRWIGELTLDGAGFHNTYPYSSGKFTDVDFATDEKGLWVVYATRASQGRIVISKLDYLNFVIEETWTTPITKSNVGNSFMICGVLYTIAAYDEVPTYINNIYDTNTGGHRILTSDLIPFQNAIHSHIARTYRLSYNPYERKLYSWNNARVEVYSVNSERIK